MKNRNDLYKAQWESRGASYQPRTRHFHSDGTPKYTNRLFLESSPYLLQHAHNPVDWFPWGEEAFSEAKKRKAPVLVSIGYSTCHWCHVMEEESFEDEEIAEAMNANYICIKIDREERPDIDSIYMAATQALTGRGGWPMTVWLTPDKKPFYAGTYFPARDGDRGSPTGFLSLLVKLREIYNREPEKITDTADELQKAVEQTLAAPAGSELPSVAALHKAFELYHRHFDSIEGGMRSAPKFPSSLPIRFLLRYHKRTGDARALDMATLTLRKMAAGGMYDHVAGGFHRYSVDAEWLVPHFEKMLYDNALLMLAYLEGYQVTGDLDFARVAREVADYVLREMTSPEGGFYSATDADSLTPSGKREEGYYFTWTPEELRKVLPADLEKLIVQYYGVSEAGNFEGRTILHTPRRREAVAFDLGYSPEQFQDSLAQSRSLLASARGQRPAPLRDDKILTSWNGLMLSALAKAGFVLDEPRYVEAAESAADFIFRCLYDKGSLKRTFTEGQVKLAGYLDDYAFLMAGLLDLFEVTSELKWFEMAEALDQHLERSFEDPIEGGFYRTGQEHEKLLTREKPGYDGAEPSGNSMAVMNLLRLYQFTGNDHYRERADRALRFFSKVINEAPSALSEMLLALDYRLSRPKQIAIITPPSREKARPLLQELRKHYVPNSVLTCVAEDSLQRMASKIFFVSDKLAVDGQPTAYVCENGTCQLPTVDPSELALRLES